jgi:LDH2 family malate/lactate/ureidoglycolate dehydrogenase
MKIVKSDGMAMRTLLFREQVLRDFCRDLLAALGVPVKHAKLVGDSLVTANLRGVDSHGVHLLTTYVAQIQAGGVNTDAVGAVVAESGACLVYDGRDGMGQVVADQCTDHAIRLARNFGISVVVARNSHHFGAAGYWGEKLSRAGHIGIVMSNASPAVPPWQGRSARLGTNPLCVVVPATGAGRWLLDMATSTVALGKVANAAFLGQDSIPAWWGFLDADGNPTTQTHAAQRGMPTPIGGYKGTGLAMLVEIFCSVLSGGPMALEIPVDRTGADPLRISHMFMAVDPGRFLAQGGFHARMVRLNTMVKSSQPARSFEEVLVAGEPEWRVEEQRQREGIPVPVRLWERLSAIATSVQVVPPSGTKHD